MRDELTPAGLAVQVGQVRTASDTATASFDVRWDLGQGRVWSYHTEAGLHRAAGGDGPAWVLGWAPTVVHPQLAARQQLALSTTPAEPAPVVDRSGVPLLTPTPVVSVLLDRLQTGDLPKVTGALATALSPIEPSITQQTITDGAARTPDGRAYTVAVLRETDYQTVKNAIHDLPGVRFTTSERLLAPDAGFARQVLPAVRTGLAAQLDGVPGWSVAVVDAAGGTVATLAEEAPKPGSTVDRGAGPRPAGRRGGRGRAPGAAGGARRDPAVDGEPARRRPERCGGRRGGTRAHRPLPAGLHVQDRDGAGRHRAGRAARPTPRWPARARP